MKMLPKISMIGYDFPMNPAPSITQKKPESTALEQVDLHALVGKLEREIVNLRRQVAWFQRQIFGQKSEKHVPEYDAVQGVLGIDLNAVPGTPLSGEKTTVAAHQRQSKPAAFDESNLFFDEQKVPVEVIDIANPEIAGLRPDEYEVIGEKVSHRLAQRPGSYVILKYVRPVIKRLDTQTLSCPPAPIGVIDGSRADVSFLVGVMLDKCAYHQPLYRQHQRLRDSGINVSRAWLTQIMQAVMALLEPIHDAQLLSIQSSRVKAMDETPIKAGPTGGGKMKAAYFWPIYGERDEICFLYYPSRRGTHVQQALGLSPPEGAVLQTDGYAVYKQYAQKTGITHAQCWAHARRKIVEAKDVEPDHAEKALTWIAALYVIEAGIRDENLTGAAKRCRRQERARPIVDQIFKWIDKQFESNGFLPSSPLLKALAYIRERRIGLEVYLDDADVAIDTNHLERALRVIPMGRRNWLFAWTELGAKHIGIVQSLLTTCRLHDINPYDYFVDVLQRIDQHPAALVEQLTPRRWKELYASNPLRSDLHLIIKERQTCQ